MTETSLIYGKPLVKPTSLETELEKIRSAAAQDDLRKEIKEKGSAQARAKATLSNFIIINLIGDSEAEKQIDSIIDRVCLAYPSRFFVIDSFLKSGTIATAVSSRCFLADSGIHVCSEEVFISASSVGVKLVSNILLSLLAPDVRNNVLLLLPKGQLELDAAKKELLGKVFNLSNKVLFDSGDSSDFKQILTELLNLNSSAVCDLNWRRGRKLRNLVREIFDAELLSDSSEEISKIAISCVNSNEDLAKGLLPATAQLFASWLVASLENKVAKKMAKDSGIVLVCQGKKSNLNLEILPSSVKNNTLGLDISQINFEFSGKKLSGTVEINIDQEKHIAEVATKLNKSAEISTRNVPLVIPKFEELLLQEIVVSKEDEGYVKSCLAAMQISKLA